MKQATTAIFRDNLTLRWATRSMDSVMMAISVVMSITQYTIQKVRCNVSGVSVGSVLNSLYQSSVVSAFPTAGACYIGMQWQWSRLRSK
jgi:hypothetical protein